MITSQDRPWKEFTPDEYRALLRLRDDLLNRLSDSDATMNGLSLKLSVLESSVAQFGYEDGTPAGNVARYKRYCEGELEQLRGGAKKLEVYTLELQAKLDAAQQRIEGLERENIKSVMASNEAMLREAETIHKLKERIAQLEQAVEHALQCLGDAGSNKEHDPSWIRPKGLTREQVNERCIQAYHALHQALAPAQKEGQS